MSPVLCALLFGFLLGARMSLPLLFDDISLRNPWAAYLLELASLALLVAAFVTLYEPGGASDNLLFWGVSVTTGLVCLALVVLTVAASDRRRSASSTRRTTELTSS